MRRGLPLTLAALALTLAFAGQAGAAPPRWTSSQLPTAGDSYGRGVGVDAAGTVTVLARENDRLIGRMRRPGGAFSAPVDLGPGGVADRRWGPSPPTETLAVADNGDVLLVMAERFCPLYESNSCSGRLYARVGPDITRLSPPEVLAESAYLPSVSVAPDGHMVVAWRAAGGQVEAAVRGPGADFSQARQRVSEPSASAPARGGGGYVSTSINSRGQAAVAWQERSGQTDVNRVSFKETRTGFGPPQAVGPPRDEADHGMLHVAVDSTGRAVLALGGPQAGFASRSPGGLVGPITPFGGGPGWFVGMHARPETQVVSIRDSAYSPITLRVAIGESGGPFGPARVLRIPGLAGGYIGSDARGNLHVGGQGDTAGGAMRAATLSRFDLQPSEVSGPLGPDGLTSLPSMAVNPRGQAAMVWSVPARPSTPAGGLLMLAERAPDADPPAVAMRVAARRGGRARARIRCSESCRARATVTVSRVSKRRARSSLSSKSGTVTLRPRAERLFATRLKPAERRRLRALVSRKRRLTARVTVSAEDGWGNRRSATRRISIKRLLR